MAISGGYKRGQSLARRQSNAETIDIDSERARVRALKKKNQKRGVMLIILMGLLVLVFLIGAWYLDGIIKDDPNDIVSISQPTPTCNFTTIHVPDWNIMTERARKTVCEVIENRDMFSGSELTLIEIISPPGFAHAIDLKFTGSRANAYRILVDENVIIQLGALLDAEKSIIENNLFPNLVDLRIPSRAYLGY